MASIWTDVHIERLKKLYDKGHSCTSIAADLGEGFSRNSVIGKIHRLGLRLRGAGRHASFETRGPRSRLEPKPRLRRIVLLPPAKQIELRCTEVVPLSLSLLDLEPDNCRWPFGHGPFVFCGHPSMEGSKYCSPHFYLSIGPGTPSERFATKGIAA